MVLIRLHLDWKNMDVTTEEGNEITRSFNEDFVADQLDCQVEVSRVPIAGELLSLVSTEWLVIGVKHQVYNELLPKNDETAPDLDAEVYVQPAG